MPGEPDPVSGSPRRAALSGAVAAMALVGIAVPVVMRVLPIVEGPLDALVWAAVAAAIAAVFGLMTIVAVRLLARIPGGALAVGTGAVAALAIPLLLVTILSLGKGGESTAGVAASALSADLALVLAAAGVGAGISLLWRGARWQRLLGVLISILGLAAIAIIAIPPISSGTEDYVVAPIPPTDAVPAIPDPSRRGPFEVDAFTHGSGIDARFITTPVDASHLVAGWTSARTRYWGFGPDRLPIDGHAWVPRGPGPYPLVLLIQGAHNMLEPSDMGLSYLGELLASRGYAAAAIDENFLNLGPLRFGGSFPGDLHRATGVRGWLALEHARAFARWASEPGNPLRGGEAAAVAAALSRFERHPDDPTLSLGYAFQVQAVVALAPADGQYLVAGVPPPLDVSFLALHGAADNDVSSFTGSRLYQRASLAGGGYRLKASVFIDRANHGQFNTAWGRVDLQPPFSWFFNVRPLLSGDEQRRIAEAYVVAFLDVALKGDREALPLLRDWRSGSAWLPRTSYRTHFEDTSFRPLATFEEDIDPGTLTLSGGRARGVGLSLWREAALAIRPLPMGLAPSDLGTRAVWLGWRPGGAAAQHYDLELPAIRMTEKDLLAFSAACPRAPPPDAMGREGDRTSPEWLASRAGLELTVELVDEAGQTARLPASVPPPLRTRFSTFAALEPPSSDTALQTVLLPIEDFARQNPRLDLNRVRQVRFAFDRSQAGMLVLDEIGLLDR